MSPPPEGLCSGSPYRLLALTSLLLAHTRWHIEKGVTLWWRKGAREEWGWEMRAASATQSSHSEPAYSCERDRYIHKYILKLPLWKSVCESSTNFCSTPSEASRSVRWALRTGKCLFFFFGFCLPNPLWAASMSPQSLFVIYWQCRGATENEALTILWWAHADTVRWGGGTSSTPNHLIRTPRTPNTIWWGWYVL